MQPFEKYGTLIERYTALIEKVSAFIVDADSRKPTETTCTKGDGTRQITSAAWDAHHAKQVRLYCFPVSSADSIVLSSCVRRWTQENSIIELPDHVRGMGCTSRKTGIRSQAQLSMFFWPSNATITLPVGGCSTWRGYIHLGSPDSKRGSRAGCAPGSRGLLPRHRLQSQQTVQHNHWCLAPAHSCSILFLCSSVGACSIAIDSEVGIIGALRLTPQEAMMVEYAAGTCARQDVHSLSRPRIRLAVQLLCCSVRERKFKMTVCCHVCCCNVMFSIGSGWRSTTDSMTS
eukprot:SAG31_NODE_28_length_32713_cov_39.100509_8_plen_288_part_00